MATIAVLNAAGSTVYIEVASGTGTSGDPYITRAASIATSASSIDGKITACNTGAVVISSSALPTGAATSAKQDTIITHVDGIETVLGTIDTDTGNIATSASSIDGKITACNTGAVVLAAGTAVVGKVSIDQTTPGTTNLVQIGGSLPAGTAAIGKLAANSGVDIGDVDVATLPSTWAVDLSGATFPTLTVGSHAVTNAGTFAVQDDTRTTGGETSYSAISTAAVLTAEVKGSAGQLYSLECFNNGANAVYVRMYNQTGAPGSGDAANIIWRGMIPGNTKGAGFVKSWPKGRVCGTGIGIRVSAAIADNDTTVLAANEVLVNVGYK